MNRLRRALAGTAAGAVAASGVVALGVVAAPTAHADTVTIDDAELRWGVSNEVNNGAYFGFNLMSAGKIGNPGAGGRQLTLADEGETWDNGEDAGWTNNVGDVTIEDLQADDSYAPTTFDGTRQNKSGAAVTVFNQNFAETQAVFRNGTGTIDPDQGTASIAWDGDLTVLFYTGMTFFYLSDPELTVATDGTGEVTATVGGYGSDMDDMTQWTALEDQELTIATLDDVTVTDSGIEVTPDYLGVEYDAPAGGTPQSRTSASWGAFPQDFVDFQQLTGQSSYWYSSGSSLDANKVAAPIEISYDEPAPEPEQAQVTVSQTEVDAEGATEVTVTGSGFDPSLATGTRPPLAGKPAGAYVVFGKFAESWRPSEGAAGTTRVNSSQQWAVLAEDMATIGGTNAGAIELRPDGTFEATLTIDKAAIDAKATAANLVNYGIYTYAGSGATTAEYETYTPVVFKNASTVAPGSATVKGVYGKATKIPVTVSAEAGTPTGTVALRNGAKQLASAKLTDGAATLRLPATAKAGKHALSLVYTGDEGYLVATGAVTVNLAKAKAKANVKVTKAPTTKKAGKAKVAVKAGKTAATGKVTILVKNAKGKTVKKLIGKLKNGAVTINLPKSKRGKYRLAVTYAASANFTKATAKAAYRVKKK